MSLKELYYSWKEPCKLWKNNNANYGKIIIIPQTLKETTFFTCRELQTGIRICDMTYSYVWYAAFIRVVCRNHMCDKTTTFYPRTYTRSQHFTWSEYTMWSQMMQHVVVCCSVLRKCSVMLRDEFIHCLAFISPCTNAHKWSHTRAFTHTFMYWQIHTRIRTPSHTHTNEHTEKHVHTQTHAHTHTHTLSLSLSLSLAHT